ncbi:MAG: TatD family hydrolase [Paludibacteraceae bacterium]|nr:TatD family hydrolase [Paludibacteraceae bacterium]MBQ6985025.1 TatD family hydrolase [Paludibacteraceae bacterium]
MIDTHCHIDEEAFASDREEVIARQRENGVQAMIVPGVNGASIETVLDVCHRHPNYCYPALGLHPEDVKADWEEQLATVESAIREHRNELVAIGEIGLDYYWDKTFKEEQKEVLRRQLVLARELDLPVILHNRESTEDIMRLVHDTANEKLKIKNEELKPLRGVFHCFNGSKETAQQILDMGFYVGIGGVLTFKNCKLADTLSELNTKWSNDQINEQMVLDKIVLETDAPYMAPVPHRGERNESRFMELVAERLAEIFQCPKQYIIDATSANAKQLFGLK